MVLLVVIALGLILPAAWLLVHRMEGSQPEIAIDQASQFIGLETEYAGMIQDTDSGIRKVWIGLIKDGKEHVFQDETFPSLSFISGGSRKKVPLKLKINPRKLSIGDGKAVLRISARDYSWRNWFNGNQTYLEKECIIDTKPPEISVLTRVHNIRQGGAGLVIYRVSEKDSRSGVVVGDDFFPGYPGGFQDDTIYMAFIALGYQQDLNTRIVVRATDPAGNQSQSGFPYYLKKGRFREDQINISDRFLNWKMPEFQIKGPNNEELTGIQKFLAVNRRLREENTERFRSITDESTPNLLWQGTFSRLPGSANRAKFADHRTYRYQGRVVDHQYHMGVDLASTAHSPVPAANSGKVAFTGANGIYGKTVVIDHGFGLFSLYSHLSQIQVKTGDMLQKNEILGLSGTTGMAGGDHLHYGMLVHKTFVNPIEWWDQTWIEHNITSKIDDIGRMAN